MFRATASCVLLLLAVSTAPLVSADSVEAEEWVEAVAGIENVVPVNDSAGVYAALQTAEDVVLLLQEDIDFSDAWWTPDAPITIAANQTVVLRGGHLQAPVDISSSADSVQRAGATTIDWGGRVGVMSVEPGGTLALIGTVSKHVPSAQEWRQRTNPELYVTSMALYPSVLFETGAQTVFQDTFLNWFSSNCSAAFLDEVVFRMSIGLLNYTKMGRPNATTYYVQGNATMNTMVMYSNDTLKPAGSNLLVISDAMLNCNEDPASTLAGTEASFSPASADSGGGLQAWVWVLIALGACAALAALVWVFAAAHTRRRQGEGSQLPLSASSPKVSGSVAQGEGQQRSSGSTPEGGTGSQKSTPSQPERQSSQEPAPLTTPMPSGGLGLLQQLESTWHLRHGDMQGLELSEVIGRGGSATVLKGRWRGSPVAVKLVEHGARGVPVEIIQREAALATSVSHPNIVCTYQICTLAPPGSHATAQSASQMRNPSLSASLAEDPELCQSLGLRGAADSFTFTSRQASLSLSLSNEGSLGSAAAVCSGPGRQAAGAAAAQGKGSVAFETSSTAAAPTRDSASSTAGPPSGPVSPFVAALAASVEQLPGSDAAEDALLTHSSSNSAQLSRGMSGAGCEAPGPQAPAPAVSAAAAASEEWDRGGMVCTLILMELCDKGSLETALRQRKLLWRPDGAPNPEAVLRLMLDVATGLDYLHSVSVLHGDITAGNVLLKTSGQTKRGYCAKLADFGVSRMVGGPKTSTQTSMTGTAGYTAPEVMSGGRISRASDIYSFGVLMWEVWEGRHAFQELLMPQLIFRVVHQQYRPPVPANCAPGYASLMERCWQQDPKGRPSASDVLEALREMLVQSRSGAASKGREAR